MKVVFFQCKEESKSLEQRKKGKKGKKREKGVSPSIIHSWREKISVMARCLVYFLKGSTRRKGRRKQEKEEKEEKEEEKNLAKKKKKKKEKK